MLKNQLNSKYFKKIWTLETQNLHEVSSTGNMVSDGRLEFVFVAGNGFQAKFVDQTVTCSEGIYIGGHIDSPLALDIFPHTKLIFIKMEPWTAGLIAGFNFQQSLNQTIPLKDINATLFNKLNNVNIFQDFNKTVAILNEEVEQQKSQHRDFNLILHASLFLEKNHLDFKAAKQTLLANLNISSRSLESKFGRCVGLTPKKFANTLRFREISERIYHNKNTPSLSALAYEYGYFDQAHFIRDCQKYIGKSPSQLSPESCFMTNSDEDFRYYTI